MEMDNTILSAWAEYIYRFLTIRSEYAQGKMSGTKGQSFYVETAVKFLKYWEIACRYDQLNFFKVDAGDIDSNIAPSIRKHEEWAATLNYWFNYNFVIKLSYHYVEGNYYALPETLNDVFENGFDEETHLIVLGTQFSF